MENLVPEGFVLYSGASPFLMALAPLYACSKPGATVGVGVLLGPQHLNHQGAAHGGLLATLADNAMGHNASIAMGSPIATVHLAIDYLNRASAGEWLELSTVISKRGKRVTFAECVGRVGDVDVFKAQGIFASINLPPAE